MGSCPDTDINPKGYNIQDVIREKRSNMKKTLEEKHIRELRCTTFPFSVRPRLSTSYQYIQMRILAFLFFAKHRGNVDNSGSSPLRKFPSSTLASVLEKFDCAVK